MRLPRTLALAAAVPVALALVWMTLPSAALDRLELRRVCALPSLPDPAELEGVWHRPNVRALLEANTVVRPADPSELLMGAAKEAGLESCPLAERLRPAPPGLSGCGAAGAECDLLSLDEVHAAALSQVPEKEQKVIRLALTNPSELKRLSTLPWITQLQLVNMARKIADLRAMTGDGPRTKDPADLALDLEPVTQLPNLRALTLEGYVLTDASALSKLSHLESLTVKSDPSQPPLDLGFLARWTQLERLDLGGTPVKSVQPLLGLAKLRELRLPKGVSAADRAALQQANPRLTLR